MEIEPDSEKIPHFDLKLKTIDIKKYSKNTHEAD